MIGSTEFPESGGKWGDDGDTPTLGGKILRNGYYRIDATIKGITGSGVMVNFSVADWETPVTQTLDLGI